MDPFLCHNPGYLEAKLQVSPERKQWYPPQGNQETWKQPPLAQRFKKVCGPFLCFFEEKVLYLSRKHTGGLFQKVYYGPLFNSYQ